MIDDKGLSKITIAGAIGTLTNFLAKGVSELARSYYPCENDAPFTCWSGASEYLIIFIVGWLITFALVASVFSKAEMVSKWAVIILWTSTVIILDLLIGSFEPSIFFGLQNILLFPLFYLIYQYIFIRIQSK